MLSQDDLLERKFDTLVDTVDPEDMEYPGHHRKDGVTVVPYKFGEWKVEGLDQAGIHMVFRTIEQLDDFWVACGLPALIPKRHQREARHRPPSADRVLYWMQVHCPVEEQAMKVSEMMREMSPDMRFNRGGIERRLMELRVRKLVIKNMYLRYYVRQTEAPVVVTPPRAPSIMAVEFD